MESQSEYRIHMVFFCMFGANSYAQSVLNDKISALELSRKFIKAALLVGLPKHIAECLMLKSLVAIS